ncbi:MAG: hypothetical protein DM484_01235 [Candidatus Methylumidiphilus alinenensis]|uniref:TraG N-terminal Proteobacteria domain-containing protein n=1 Tax=Candidatus Methylumidiphilus alinenensis TaxID=2202197 RepID=A0A2W4TNC5_9GAMM|nr:MAG: hypothetical protein DM484_01235 [Candidatus Methylumidiphilus alinenensis]
MAQLNYQMANTKIADPDLRQQLQLFQTDCFGPARAKFFREHTVLPTHYSPDDIDWPGSQYFQDTAGFYGDPNPNLAPRAKEEIPGFPYDTNRDFEYGGTAPASGLGKPTCKQWWTDGTVGLRQRLLSQIDPGSQSQFSTWFTATYSGKTMADAQSEEIHRLFVQEVNGGQTPGLATVANTLLNPFNGPNTVPLLATLGGAYHALEQRASFYALQQAAPIGQSLILMAVYLSLPFVLVFSSYSLETVLMASLGIFAIRFLTALWALASWIDNALTEGLGIQWWKGLIPGQGGGIAILVSQMAGALLYVGLPIVWMMALGWAGHNLAAGEGIAHMSRGIGQAAGGAIRFGGNLLKSKMSMRPGK